MVYSLFVCHFPWTMDLVSVLNRVKSFSGMIGYVIVDKDSNIVNTTLNTETAVSLAAIVIKVRYNHSVIMQ